MVAKKVRVVTRAYGADRLGVGVRRRRGLHHRAEAERKGHGTDVILTLRQGRHRDGDKNYDRYLSEWGLQGPYHALQQLRALSHPDDGDQEPPEAQARGRRRRLQARVRGLQELETLNSMTPIWKSAPRARSSRRITTSSTRATFHDFEDPRAPSASTPRARSTTTRCCSSRPRAVRPVQQGLREGPGALQLQRPDHGEVRRPAAGLLQLRRGVVDSEDVSLNISRETLQQDRQLTPSRGASRRRFDDLWRTCATTTARPTRSSSRTSAAASSLASTTVRLARRTSLATCCCSGAPRSRRWSRSRVRRGHARWQKAIYYAAGDDRDRLSKMPVVTAVLARGYDVLLCTQDVDEFFQSMREYWRATCPRSMRTTLRARRRRRLRPTGARDRGPPPGAQERGDGRPRPGDRGREEGGRGGDQGAQRPLRRDEGGAGRQGGEGPVSSRWWAWAKPRVHHDRGPAFARDGEGPQARSRGRGRGPRPSAYWSSTQSIRCLPSLQLHKMRAIQRRSRCMPACSTTRRCL